MIYVISDIHGCYDKYIKMLEKINFNSDDTLYILGDVVDRGENSIRILFDMVDRENVIPLLGNHEHSFIRVIEGIAYNRDIDNFMLDLDEDELSYLSLWMLNGGRITLEKYMELNPHEKRKIFQYINSFAKYKDIEVHNRKYLLTHSGLDNFEEDKSLDDYKIYDFIEHRPDPDTSFFRNKTVIFGHTPTVLWNKSSKKNPRIFKAPTFYNIDCGCVFTGVLGCLCLDNLSEYYV